MTTWRVRGGAVALTRVLLLASLGLHIAVGRVLAQSDTGMTAAELLNRVNRINREEITSATLASKKANDNQALITYATTIQADHKANQEALTTLSRQKKIRLASVPTVPSTRLRHLRGAEFNSAYIEDQISQHQAALNSLLAARDAFKNDPDMSLYLDQTIPIVRAHLEMARSLKSHMSAASEQKIGPADKGLDLTIRPAN